MFVKVCVCVTAVLLNFEYVSGKWERGYMLGCLVYSNQLEPLE